MRKRNRLRKTAMLVAMAVVLFLSASVRAEHASAAEDEAAGAKTPPPPVMYGTLGIFDPNHVYLWDGESSITPNTGQVSVTATTIASQNVDSIGVTFYVQKWSGTVWEDYGAGATMGGNNRSSYTNSYNVPTTSGYYYRARTIHWVIHKGIYEQGEMYTGYVLGK